MTESNLRPKWRRLLANRWFVAITSVFALSSVAPLWLIFKHFQQLRTVDEIRALGGYVYTSNQVDRRLDKWVGKGSDIVSERVTQVDLSDVKGLDDEWLARIDGMNSIERLALCGDGITETSDSPLGT